MKMLVSLLCIVATAQAATFTGGPFRRPGSEEAPDIDYAWTESACFSDEAYLTAEWKRRSGEVWKNEKAPAIIVMDLVHMVAIERRIAINPTNSGKFAIAHQSIRDNINEWVFNVADNFKMAVARAKAKLKREGCRIPPTQLNPFPILNYGGSDGIKAAVANRDVLRRRICETQRSVILNVDKRIKELEHRLIASLSLVIHSLHALVVPDFG